VRALVLTSSRARPGAPADALSDYDVIVAVSDPAAFLTDEGWQSAYARPLARWGDEHELHGLGFSFLGIVHEDWTKVDYMIWPEELLERVAAEESLPDVLDVGYRVLLDETGITARWPAPSYRAHIPSPPAQGEYDALVEELWWSSSYVAKYLWRGEIVAAKFALDVDMKLGVLRRFLEWRIEIANDWSVKPGAYGRGLERLLDPETAAELAATYVGSDVEENWEALFATVALFRRVAREVADELGLAYPQALDDTASAYLAAVRALPRES
jgi:aminoglycoside 6-adenylyltransferase